MNMKRLLALLLALVMVFTLFACGESEGEYDDYADDDDEKTSQNDDEDDDDDEEEGTDPTGDATDPTGDATEPTEGGNSGTPVVPGGNTNTDNNNNNGSTLQPEQPEEPAVSTILGRWEGDTYINEYVGFRITFPNTWSHYPVDSSVDLANPFPNASVVQLTDMSASISTGNSISVIYQNPGAYNGGITASNTEEQNINMILAEEATLREVYEGMGMTVSSLGKDYITFAGQTHCVLKTVLTYFTVEMHIIQLYTYGSGNTPVTITISGMGANELQNLLNMFSPA